MDRDRNRRRDLPRDVPEEDRYFGGGGQSYRPDNVRPRSPPRHDTYRARSPPRRPDYMQADTYRRPRSRSPPPRRDDFRRRSPSPPKFRGREPRGGDSYRGRPRSPLPARREDLPRDDLFRRDAVRGDRDFRDTRDFRDDRDRGYIAAPPVARSPLPRFRDRSAVPLKRVREPSPMSSRGRRTPPPPAKRERLASPPRPARYDDFPSRGVSPARRRYSPDPRDRRPSPPRGPTRDYRAPRSRSPFARNDRVDPRSVDDWRRPRSPVRQDYLRDESAVNSAATSRRSSPPIHPSRAALQQPPLDDRPRSSRASPRDYDMREPYRAAPEPVPAPTIRDRGYDDDRGYTRESIPPPREPRREDDLPVQRAPPTGPSAQRSASAMAPPTGPAVTTPSGPRGAGAPPSGPRGGPPTPRGDYSGRGRGGFGNDFAPRGRGSFTASFRGGRGGAPGPGFGRGEGGFGRGEGGFGRGDASFARSASVSQDTDFGARAPPSGPRSSFSQAQPPAFRQSSSSNSASAFQRPQRFENGDAGSNIPTGPKAGRRPTEPAVNAMVNRVHPALADLPKIIEGGQKAEPLVDRSKLNKLEDEAEKLRKQIEEKEARKRKSLREWDQLARDTQAAALRSELAEEALRQLNGEAESQAAF